MIFLKKPERKRQSRLLVWIHSVFIAIGTLLVLGDLFLVREQLPINIFDIWVFSSTLILLVILCVVNIASFYKVSAYSTITVMTLAIFIAAFPSPSKDIEKPRFSGRDVS